MSGFFHQHVFHSHPYFVIYQLRFHVMNLTQFVYSPLDGQVGCFQFFLLQNMLPVFVLVYFTQILFLLLAYVIDICYIFKKLPNCPKVVVPL